MIERLLGETRNIAKAQFVHDGMGGKLNGMWTPAGLGAPAWVFFAAGREESARHGGIEVASEVGDEAAERLITGLAGAGGVAPPGFSRILTGRTRLG